MTEKNAVCPNCPRHCLLDAPGCGRGEQYARELRGESTPDEAGGRPGHHGHGHHHDGNHGRHHHPDSVQNSIYHRVSIRKYEDKPVEPEKTEAILRAAMQAPSAGNQQPWEFFVVTDPAKLEALSMVSPYSGCTKDAPAAIVSAYRKECPIPEYAQIDLSIAMENLWLETDAQGLGGVWLGIAPLEERMKEVETILSLPASLRAFAIFPYGYPAESRAQEDRFDAERIHYIR